MLRIHGPALAVLAAIPLLTACSQQKAGNGGATSEAAAAKADDPLASTMAAAPKALPRQRSSLPEPTDQ